MYLIDDAQKYLDKWQSILSLNDWQIKLREVNKVVQMYEFAILIWATKQNEFVFIYIRILVFGNTFYIFFCV